MALLIVILLSRNAYVHHINMVIIQHLFPKKYTRKYQSWNFHQTIVLLLELISF